MRLEIRRFKNDYDRSEKLMMVAIVDNENESLIIDEVVGNIPINDDEGTVLAYGKVKVKLADGYGEHYLQFEKTEHYLDEKKVMDLVERSSIFLEEVLPQIGKLSVDVLNLNELSMLLTEFQKEFRFR